MADNIFDAQRDRRIQHLQQQSVSNIVRTNPNLRGVLTRYEDAEVSRIKLLELQRLRNQKITKGERALLKAVAKGRGRRRGRSPKKTRTEEPPIKPQTQIEVEAEEKRRRLAQQDRFLELEDFKQQREFLTAAQDRQQRELVRQQQFITDMALLGQRENQRLTDFATGQNRILADAQIAQFNQQQENLRAGQRDLGRAQDRQLEADRLNLQRRQIDNQFIDNREQRALAYARLDNDRERYNADARRAEANRDRDIGVAQRQLQDVQERVAADNARQHAQLQATQELALRQLAAQQRDNELQHQREQNRIDNQRAVDAERAITDRELIQGFTSAVDALQRLQTPQELPSGRGLVEDFDSSSGQIQSVDTSLRDRVQPEPELVTATTLSSQTTSSTPSAQRADDLRRVDIVEATDIGREIKKPKRFEGGATEQEISLEAATPLPSPAQTEASEFVPSPTPRQKLKPGQVIKAPVQGTKEQRLATPAGRPVKTKPALTTTQQNLFQSPAGQAFAKEVDLSLKALEPRGGITDSAIERDLQAIAAEVKDTLYDREGKPTNLRQEE